MKAERPKHRRVYVEARDADTKKRVCATFYDCTPEQVMARLKAAAMQDERKRREPLPA
jgi:uncharacterized protein (DUF433 family)